VPQANPTFALQEVKEAPLQLLIYIMLSHSYARSAQRLTTIEGNIGIKRSPMTGSILWMVMVLGIVGRVISYLLTNLSLLLPRKAVLFPLGCEPSLDVGFPYAIVFSDLKADITWIKLNITLQFSTL